MRTTRLSPRLAHPPQARAVATQRRHRSRAAGADGGPRKLLHIVRHAEGFHNTERKHVAERSHDARLTPNGEAQCAALHAALGELAAFSSPSLLVVASPLTRTLQTASLCFPGARIVALEEVRETCNFRCDGRRSLELIRPEFPHVDFSNCTADDDALWAHYEGLHGGADAYRGHRESADLPGLAARAARARVAGGAAGADDRRRHALRLPAGGARAEARRPRRPAAAGV